MYSARPDNRRRKKANIVLHPPPKTGDNGGFVGKQRLLAPPAQPPPMVSSEKNPKKKWDKVVLFRGWHSPIPTIKSPCTINVEQGALYGGLRWRHPIYFHPPPTL